MVPASSNVYKYLTGPATAHTIPAPTGVRARATGGRFSEGVAECSLAIAFVT
jgi:hypothetical protein